MSGTVGVVLAGGLSRRMGGGDKTLRALDGIPILARVIGRFAPQVDALVLNANGPPERFAAFGLEIAADVTQDFAGPLAGVLAGMRWAAARDPAPEWLVSVASDAPFLPRDLVARLRAAARAAGTRLAAASSGGRAHPVFGLWPVDLLPALEHALLREDVRKVDRFTARHGCAEAVFDDHPVDPFFNVNRPQDVDAAEALLRHPEASR